METLESLHRKLEGAKDLKSVVRTMKIVAALNIGQYEKAVQSLVDYYYTLALGILVYLKSEKKEDQKGKIDIRPKTEKLTYSIVFGSDQGLVGQFNDSLSDFVCESLQSISGKKEIWAVGERVQLLLIDAGFTNTQLFTVPNSVQTITALVNQILLKSEETQKVLDLREVYVFHNQQKAGIGYQAVFKRLLPLDETWKHSFSEYIWPTNKIPQIIDGKGQTLIALIHSYLFTSLYKACAESLASENACRLAAMQRAEKNIDELLEDLKLSFHSLRQSTIDAELFDVVSGFEAIKKDA
jgi:F-type H+-transporting ATPase subunit gamma